MKKPQYVVLSLLQAIVMLTTISIFALYVHFTEINMETITSTNMELHEELDELKSRSVIDRDVLNQIEMRNEGIKYQEENNNK